MKDDSMRQPDSERHQPIVIKESLLGKIVMGLFCSAIVALIMNFAGLRWLIVHVFALFLSLFGKDSYEVKPTEPVKAAAQDTAERYKEKAVKVIAPVVGPATLPMTLPVIGHDTPDVIKAKAEVKEAERKRREESERRKLLADADVLGVKYADDWALEKLRVEVERAQRQAKEKPERDLLAERAKAVGMTIPPDLDIKMLRAEVKKAEAQFEEKKKDADAQTAYEQAMADYKRRLAVGPNARCPGCRHETRFAPSRMKTQFVCSKCSGIFPVKRAVANFTPPPPPKKPAPSRKGIMGGMFR